MNKKILALAFISAALFLSCSADGTFNPNDYPVPADPGPGTDPGPGPGPSPGGGTGSCTDSGNTCKENVSQSSCNYTFAANGTCSTTNFQYCANYGDCDRIGGNYISSKSDCFSLSSGILASISYCISNGFDIEGIDYN